MAWYNTPGTDNDVVISTRVTVARNIAETPFPHKADEATVGRIISDVTAALGSEDMRLTLFDDRRDCKQYSEKQYCARTARALLMNNENETSISLCGEDHIQLRAIMPGFAPEEVFRRVFVFDNIIDSRLTYAFVGETGYLTCRPEDLGTGTHLCVTLFLPALTDAAQITGLSRAVEKYGLGLDGGEGCLYELSNRTSLGFSEDELISVMSETVSRICMKEREIREILRCEDADKLADRIMRSLGVLRFCRSITMSEFLRHWSDVRLGVALGITDCATYEELGAIMIGALSSSLSVSTDGICDSSRASYLNRTFA